MRILDRWPTTTPRLDACRRIPLTLFGPRLRRIAARRLPGLLGRTHCGKGAAASARALGAGPSEVRGWGPGVSGRRAGPAGGVMALPSASFRSLGLWWSAPGSACAGDPAVDVQVVWSPRFAETSRRTFSTGETEEVRPVT